MKREVRIMSTVVDRERVRHMGNMLETFAVRPENEEVTLKIGDLKALMNVVRDFAVMTHISEAEVSASTAFELVADYVDQASPRDTEQPGIYKTTILAQLFGVSVTAINKWIDEGRFVGYKRQPGKHAKIPSFTPFRKRDGSVVPLRKLIEEYSTKPTTIADEDERELLRLEIKRLQEKYKVNSYDAALRKGLLTPSDETWWRFYERKLGELNG